MVQTKTLKKLFTEQFQNLPEILAKSPGRINIIGEHTDYNLGFVLPAAIDKYIYIAVRKRDDNEVQLYSADYNETYYSSLDDNLKNAPEWTKFVIGVAQILKRKAPSISGFNAYIIGEVPLGAGLSSSAALTCATGFALNQLYNLNLTQLEIAKIGQQTEHEYIGVQCGLMDQFASTMGKASNLIKLDCRDLTFEYIPANWLEYEILLLNTNVKHNLASSAYNDRRATCEKGVAWVQREYPNVSSLRDITLEQLKKIVLPKSAEVYNKCKFVIEENQRLLDVCTALVQGDFNNFGKLMFQAHWALSKEYEVSCDELDFLINAVENKPEVIGARMMGGGFGGCTINIIKKGYTKLLTQEITSRFRNHFGYELTPIQIQIADGSSLLIED